MNLYLTQKYIKLRKKKYDLFNSIVDAFVRYNREYFFELYPIFKYVLYDYDFGSIKYFKSHRGISYSLNGYDKPHFNRLCFKQVNDIAELSIRYYLDHSYHYIGEHLEYLQENEELFIRVPITKLIIQIHELIQSNSFRYNEDDLEYDIQFFYEYVNKYHKGVI